MNKYVKARADQREAERATYARDYPQITRELVEERVEQAEQAGRTLVAFEIFVGGNPPKARANNSARTLQLPLTGKPPRSNTDSRCVPISRHIYRCWWLVSDLRVWLRITKKNSTRTLPKAPARKGPKNEAS